MGLRDASASKNITKYSANNVPNLWLVYIAFHQFVDNKGMFSTTNCAKKSSSSKWFPPRKVAVEHGDQH